MPVDEDFSLDSPDGITQEDIDEMNRQADELEQIAIKAEANAERVKKSADPFKNMDFVTKNILDKSLTAGTSGVDVSELYDMIIKILAEQEKNKKVDEEQSKKIDSVEEEVKKAERERKILEAKIKSEIRGAEGTFNEFLSATHNPIGFSKGRLMGYIGKAGIIGAIITTVYSIAQTLWNEYMKSFQAGGANDIRKLMDDRDKEMAELEDILARRNGRVFFTGDVDLRQGAPQISNTERLRDQVVRYQALHLGE